MLVGFSSAAWVQSAKEIRANPQVDDVHVLVMTTQKGRSVLRVALVLLNQDAKDIAWDNNEEIVLFVRICYPLKRRGFFCMLLGWKVS